MVLPLGHAHGPAGFTSSLQTWAPAPVEWPVMASQRDPTPKSPTGAPASPNQAERYRTLLEINNALVANLTQEALFHAIAEALRRVLPFDRTAIFLHDPQRDVLRLFVLESSLTSKYFAVGLEMPVGDSHVGRVFQRPELVLPRDLATDPDYSPAEPAY